MNRPPPLHTPAAVASPEEAARRFVDITAKMALVMAVLMLVYCLGQLVVFTMLGRFDLAGYLEPVGVAVPARVAWLLEHAATLGWAMLLGSLLFVLVSWGLLRRREWGRLGFIAALVLVGLLNFAAVPVVDSVFTGYAELMSAPAFDNDEARQVLARMQATRWFSMGSLIATALAFAGLHAWLVVRLCRPEVRRLFGR